MSTEWDETAVCRQPFNPSLQCHICCETSLSHEQTASSTASSESLPFNTLKTRHVPRHARPTRHAPRTTRHAPRATRHAPRATRHAPRATRHAPSCVLPHAVWRAACQRARLPCLAATCRDQRRALRLNRRAGPVHAGWLPRAGTRRVASSGRHTPGGFLGPVHAGWLPRAGTRRVASSGRPVSGAWSKAGSQARPTARPTRRSRSAHARVL
jgi:hypothetical protein